MKKLAILCFVLMAAFAFSGNAGAVLFTDVEDPDPDILVDSIYTINFNIVDFGFDPLTDIITEATVFISLTDDPYHDKDQQDFVSLTIGSSTPTPFEDVDSVWDRIFPVYLPDLQDDGLLSVILEMEVGDDLMFQNAELNASTAPEPATMLLVGSGLVGLAGVGRKRFRK